MSAKRDRKLANKLPGQTPAQKALVERAVVMAQCHRVALKSGDFPDDAPTHGCETECSLAKLCTAKKLERAPVVEPAPAPAPTPAADAVEPALGDDPFVALHAHMERLEGMAKVINHNVAEIGKLLSGVRDEPAEEKSLIHVPK